MEKKHLRISALCQSLKTSFSRIPDWRKRRVKYALAPILMEGMKVFLYQLPSLLQYYQQRNYGYHVANDRSLIGGGCGISQSQFREVIDLINSHYFRRSFKLFFRLIQRSGLLKRYKVLDRFYPVAIDGVTYHSSKHIHCKRCLKRGNNYLHQALQPYLCHPGSTLVIPLMAEPIGREDGKVKQDCELNASYRLLKQMRKDHPKLPILILGDGLFSKQPFIEQCLEQKFDYIIMAKPLDHKYLFEMVLGAESLGEVSYYEWNDKKGLRYVCKYINDMPLNGREDAISVNFFSCCCYDVNNNICYQGSWVTSIALERFIMKEMVATARARWKDENEGFNSMKNQGYHLMHNFGHGQKNLSFNLYLLNVLAMAIHRITEMASPLFRTCYKRWKSRTIIWQKVRNYCDIKRFESWDQLWIMLIGPQWERAP